MERFLAAGRASLLERYRDSLAQDLNKPRTSSEQMATDSAPERAIKKLKAEIERYTVVRSLQLRKEENLEHTRNIEILMVRELQRLISHSWNDSVFRILQREREDNLEDTREIESLWPKNSSKLSYCPRTRVIMSSENLTKEQ